jgi:DNA ligase-1
MKAIKKYRPELSPELLYHVYDIVDNTRTFEERNDLIKVLSPFFPSNVVTVPTYICHNETDVIKYHTIFTKAGYEGTMIRDPQMGYEIGKRSYSLLKLKDFVDAEYQIVDVVDGAGSDVGLAIFELETTDGQRFNCRPEGTQENRADLYKNRKKLIGLYMTVRYQELSRDGIPIFPVGVAIREWGEF